MSIAVPGGSLEGAPGAPGATPVLQAGNASALPPGSAPQVALRLTAPNTYAIDVSWPRAADGAAGTPGTPGAAGATPTLQVGNITSLAAGAAATAAVRSLGGSAYALDLGIPVGATGATGGKGDAGVAGATPTLQVGNITSLAAGAAATAAVRALGGNAYAVDLGIPAGATGATGAAANLSTFRRVYVSSIEITSSNSSYGFAAAAPATATEVEVECVGGGASGFSGRTDGTVAGHGGEPGSVARLIRRVADVPATLAITIGAGGSQPATNASTCVSNAGGTTSFGSLLKALGGRGGSYAALGDYWPGQLGQPSNPPTGRPGRSNGVGTNGSPNYLDAQPSQGPGGGGAGLYNTTFSTSNYYGAGGAAAVHLPASTVSGGGVAYANQTSGGGIGGNAVDVFGYGSGGGGATGSNNAPSGNGIGGGAGGLPGGGGGGGHCIPSGSGGTVGGSAGGAGGRGAVRLHFYRYEAP